MKRRAQKYVNIIITNKIFWRFPLKMMASSLRNIFWTLWSLVLNFENNLHFVNDNLAVYRVFRCWVIFFSLYHFFRISNLKKCLIRFPLNIYNIPYLFVDWMTIYFFMYISMTSLSAQKVAQPTKWRFLSKNLNQLVILVIVLAFTCSWVNQK